LSISAQRLSARTCSAHACAKGALLCPAKQRSRA
jgi:hypothetical protein